MARGSSPEAEPAPKKQRFARIRQLKQVYDMTARIDPGVRWWLLLTLVGPIVVGLVIGLLTGHPIYFTILGIMAGVVAAMFVLSRRAERAMYVSLEGQPGASGAALSSIRRGWTVEQEPVAAEGRTQDMVFRAVGRAGIVLVGDGPPNRVRKMLEGERRKVNRVAPNVPVHLFTVGDGGSEGEVPLRRLAGKVQRLKPTLTKQEVDAVHKRLRALGGIRTPVPKGVDPLRARPDRRAMRGR